MREGRGGGNGKPENTEGVNIQLLCILKTGEGNREHGKYKWQLLNTKIRVYRFVDSVSCNDSWQLPNLTHEFFSMYLFIYSSLHFSSMSCSSSGETNCINTASGNCHSVLVAVSCAGWEHPSLRVQTRPKLLNFFRRKNPQHAFLRRGSKRICPMSQLCGMSMNLVIYVNYGLLAKFQV